MEINSPQRHRETEEHKVNLSETLKLFNSVVKLKIIE